VAGLSPDEKAVWARTYSSAYKRAWTAASNDRKLTRRRERRGDVVGRSSGLPSIPKEVAMAAAHEELSRFRAARDPSPRAPTVTATTSAVPQLPLTSPPYVELVGVTAPPPRPPPASPSASSPQLSDFRSYLPPSPPLSAGRRSTWWILHRFVVRVPPNYDAPPQFVGQCHAPKQFWCGLSTRL